MKLSVSRLLLLLASCSFFNKLKDCDAASSLELTNEEGNEDAGALLRGANSNNNNNNMIFVVDEEETKKEVFAGEAADQIIATDVVTMIKDEEGFNYDQFRRELEEEGRRHRWSTYCSTGRTHEEKCGGSRPDCCNEKVKDANENISFLTCRKKNKDSDNNRCHEIHSDAIDWPMFCAFDGSRSKGEECDLPGTTSSPNHGKCCSKVANFDEYTVNLQCLKVPNQNSGICTEIPSGSRKWSEVCSSGTNIQDQTCTSSSSSCCSHVYHLGDRTVSLVCDNGKCLQHPTVARHDTWSTRCDNNSGGGGGGNTWGEKCGGGADGDCCTAREKDENGNVSFLTCRKETEGSSDERCQEIHSDAIDWPMLCNRSGGGGTIDQTCTEDQDCCQEDAAFGDYIVSLECSSGGTCQEFRIDSSTNVRHDSWLDICNSEGGSQSHGESCDNDDRKCCDTRLKDENGNYSYLECMKKDEDSKRHRCHEVHSDVAIDWEKLCSISGDEGRRLGEKCGSVYGRKDYGSCCSYGADFRKSGDDDSYALYLWCDIPHSSMQNDNTPDGTCKQEKRY